MEECQYEDCAMNEEGRCACRFIKNGECRCRNVLYTKKWAEEENTDE